MVDKSRYEPMNFGNQSLRCFSLQTNKSTRKSKQTDGQAKLKLFNFTPKICNFKKSTKLPFCKNTFAYFCKPQLKPKCLCNH